MTLPRETTRDTMAQLLVCATGCCCGRTDRCKPPVPLEWLRSEWRARRLMKPFQLTVSGCLGPCDRMNVVAVVSPHEVVWLGDLREEHGHFVHLVDWADASVEAGSLLPLPEALAPLRFERFPKAASCPTPLSTPPGVDHARTA